MLMISPAALRSWCSFFALLVAATPSYAQTGRNVAIVINEDSPASTQIGTYYASKRDVPAENIIRIKTTSADEISRQEYARTIETPVASALSRARIQDRILYIVLTKGVPLRITGTAGQNGTGSSVDSELTLLYRRMTGRPVPPAGFIENPYYLGSAAVANAKSFSHRQHDIFLVTRLDGLTVDDALALVDRGTAPTTRGAIVFDQGKEPSTAIADGWTAQAAGEVKAVAPERKLVIDETPLPAVTADEVIGYYSAGSQSKRDSRLKFTAGALVASLASSDARTFQTPSKDVGPSLGALIREGATGAAGNVSEPYLQSSLRPQVLFPAYLSGLNLAEAFYLALPHLGWQSVVIGDPLCAPFPSSSPSAEDLDPPLDIETELPAFFSKARVESVRLTMKGIPPQAVALMVRAESRMQRGDKAGARQSLEQAAELAPGAAAAQMQLAMIHESAGEFDQAVRRYREIVKVEPNNVLALNNLAYSLATRLGSPAEALPLARRAVALAPADPTIVDTLAWVEHLLGNEQEASRLLEPIVRKSTGTAEVHLHAAIVFGALGRGEQADAQLNEALALDPGLADREDVKALRTRLTVIKK